MLSVEVLNQSLTEHKAKLIGAVRSKHKGGQVDLIKSTLCGILT